ncbi:sensor domain-containing protein [Nocardia veterana]|uniref:Sensor domain-containing protein n=1 Tax=Nocardia veterana TaxID=132249 RepID=A0A7X6LXC8_9NOCA|nr:sensor domain-containing protein [Nocardia veterana]NKY86252.1 sensor domain-containing protein [Nocardia veterana]
MGRVRKAAAVLAGVVAGVSACGGHDDGLPALPATVTAPPITSPAVTDSDVLRSLLLGPADVPAGFTPLDDAAPGNGAMPQDRSRTDPARCAKVLAPLGDLHSRPSARGAVHYSSPNFASIDIDIASYADGGAAQAFSAVQQLLHDCRSYSGTDADGTSVDYRVGGLDQPKAGSASTSFQVRTTSDGMSLYSAATVAVVGSSIVQIAETSPAQVDPAALQDLTAKQMRRLQGVAGP